MTFCMFHPKECFTSGVEEMSLIATKKCWRTLRRKTTCFISNVDHAFDVCQMVYVKEWMFTFHTLPMKIMKELHWIKKWWTTWFKRVKIWTSILVKTHTESQPNTYSSESLQGIPIIFYSLTEVYHWCIFYISSEELEPVKQTWITRE